MPKVKVTKSAQLRQFVKQFGDNLLATDGIKLNCVPCGINISPAKFQVEQHFSTKKHICQSSRKSKES
jgi:hypothetical protein